MNKFTVCPDCRGEGYTSKLGDFTAGDVDEWYGSGPERDDFVEEYNKRGGAYDERCKGCNGDRVVRICSEDACEEPVYGPNFEGCYEHDESARFEAEYLAEQAAERRVGARTVPTFSVTSQTASSPHTAQATLVRSSELVKCDHCKTEIKFNPDEGAPYLATDGSACTQVGGIHAPKVFRTHEEAARFSIAFRQSMGMAPR